MSQGYINTTRPQVHDLVLEPYAYHETLTASLQRRLVGADAADHLATVLPQAIAQLDAIGDEHAALALVAVQERLARMLKAPSVPRS